MNVKRIKEEMQFMTNVVTNDIDYLLYLLLKNDVKKEEIKEVTEEKNILNEDSLEEWFDSL